MHTQFFQVFFCFPVLTPNNTEISPTCRLFMELLSTWQKKKKKIQLAQMTAAAIIVLDWPSVPKKQ